MRKMLRTALLEVSLAALLLQSVQAQYNPNDLILGFTQAGGANQNDYVLDLGNANTAVGVGGTTAVNLSGFFNLTTFNSTFPGGLASGVNMGVLGGNQATAGRGLYITSLRSSLGAPNIALSTAPSAIPSTTMSSGVGDVSSLVAGLSLAPGGSATPAAASASSWSSVISPGANPPSFTIDTGLDPMGQATDSVIYEDLYHGTPGQVFNYVGYFTLDSTSGGSLTFTPSAIAVPEPSTCGLVAGAGVLVLWSRSRFRRRA